MAAARCQEFEEQALVHLDSLYRTALRFTRNRAEAEDVVQDTCLRAFKSFHRFTPGTNCRAWLFTILRRVFLNRVRRGQDKQLGGEPTLEAAVASATAPASERARQGRSDVRSRLPPRDSALKYA